MSQDHNFDVIVIGGGHAGAEAAWSSSRLGARTALITFQREAIGRMSCNPAIGGIGKGQMVREIDALGGLMGRVADETAIQFRMLNRRKGPAVWAPRAQSDRTAYAEAVQRWLLNAPGLTVIEGGVESLETAGDPSAAQAFVSTHGAPGASHEPEAETWSDDAPGLQISGVRLADGRVLRARAVVVTSGTFLAALMHCGEEQTCGGRIGEPAAAGLSASLARLGFRLGRLKTGTPPRLASDSIDYAALEPQAGDDPPVPFSFLTERITQAQVPCWITYTNPAVHELIRENLHRAPMYSGQIASRGPRYCPSIEDKVVRFADKTRHQVFLEPEGRDDERIYVNGVSTSLPRDVQQAMIHSIAGLERARVLQWGYAVEYDFVPPDQIAPSLMTRRVRGLFLAGQINGTSGYEEAAAQGLVAGLNAARYVAKKRPVILTRTDSYIGVMIDDLTTRGVVEPYRMFTSRAEHRMHLRYDNADARLTPIGWRAGLVCAERWQNFERRQADLEELRRALAQLRFEGRALTDLLRRPDEDGERFISHFPELREFARKSDIWARALVEIRYGGYLARQQRLMDQQRQLENEAIPADLDFQSVSQLRREAVERWTAIRPTTLGQASRASGIHPTDVTLLWVHLRRRQARAI